MRLFRLTAPVSDIDHARSFYEAVLGITADDTVPTRLYFDCGGVILVLVDWAMEGEGDHRPNPDHFYLATGQLETVRQRALEAGAGQVGAIETQAWGERSFYCVDPDHNPLCFVDDQTLFLGQGADWS